MLMTKFDWLFTVIAIIKRQVFKWKPENLKIIIYKLNEIETLIKKNVNLSVNLITNFLLEQSYLNDQ